MSIAKMVRHTMYYGNRPRRMLRKIGRYGRTLANPKAYPSAPVIQSYWFDQFSNFGDALTPWLLTKAGYHPRLSKAADAELIGVGSLLEMVPDSYRGAVWGTGLLYGRPVPLPHAQFLAVRGALTRDVLDLPLETVLGDPGLLVSLYVRPRGTISNSVGLVFHHAHADLPLWKSVAECIPGSRLIDPVGAPQHVIRQIAQCERILSSSLHGLITADAFGIPAAWLELPTHPLRGGEFKFNDYESVVLPSKKRHCAAEDPSDVLSQFASAAATVDADRVGKTQQALLSALAQAPRREVHPLRSW